MKTLIPKTRDAVLAIAAWQVGVMESPAGICHKPEQSS